MKQEYGSAPEVLFCSTAPAHLVTNDGDGSATFLVLQGIAEYDYAPLV